MKSTLFRKLVAWFLIPISGIYLFSNIVALSVRADSPDPYQHQNSSNSGVVDGHFNPDVKKQWSVSYYPKGMPAISDNTVYYLDYTPSTQIGTIKAVDIYSKLTLWSYPLAYQKALCSPVYAENVVYTCEDDILALDAKTGNKIKSFPKPSTGLKYNRITTADNLILGFTGYSIYAFDRTSGVLVWQKTISGSPVDAVIVYNHKIFFNTMAGNGFTYAINLVDGSIFWSIVQPGSVGKLILIEDLGKLYDLSRGWAMDINTGAKSPGDVGWQGWPFLVDGNKWVSYFNGDTSINFMSKDAGTGSNLSLKINAVIGQTIVSNQFQVDGKIYFVTNKQNLLEMDTAGNLLSSRPLLTTDPYASKDVVIDHGRLFVYNTGHGGYEFQYYDHEPVVILGHEPFSLKSPYTNAGSMGSYLGQLHCHYIPDLDLASIYEKMPVYTPATTEERYRDAGYDFVALTEHNTVTPDPQVGGILHVADAEEDTQGSGGNHILAIGINTPIDQTLSDQKRIDNVVAQIGIPIFAHPNANSYSITEEELLSTKNYAHLEIYNRGVKFWQIVAGESSGTDKWDKLLGSRRNILATAGDDYTPGNAGFDGAAVVVFSETKTQADVMKNLKAGNFYALQGSKAPRINISSDNKSVNITADKISNFKFIGKGGLTLKEENSVNSSTYSIAGDEIYVRAEVEADGKKAWSQPIFVNPNPISQTASSGVHNFDFGQTKATTNTDADVSAGILDDDQKPENAPPLGYLSPVYSFATSGTVLTGTELAVSYAGNKIATNENNLSWFTFSEATTQWEKVASTVDTVSKTVKASLSHFSLYTLSAEVPGDTVPPSINLTNPASPTDLEGEVPFTFEITDDNAVVSTSFAVDDKPVENTQGDNIFTVNVNTTEIANGSHKIQAFAEDFKGNRTEKSFDFSVLSSFVPPQLNLTAPAADDYLYEPSNLSGNLISSLPVSEIQYFLDGIYLENLEFIENNFQKLIDWSQFKEGVHKLRVVIRDSKGNEGVIEREITIGQETEATITSPLEKRYLHSAKIPIEVSTKPENVQVIIKIDSKDIPNHSKINAYDYALGEHKISVYFKDKLIAERKFQITTSIEDQIKLVSLMYKSGHIKNQGIANAIIVHLEIARLWELLGWERMKDKTLEQLIKFIRQQSSLPKPKIDSLAKELCIKDLVYILRN